MPPAWHKLASWPSGTAAWIRGLDCPCAVPPAGVTCSQNQLQPAAPSLTALVRPASSTPGADPRQRDAGGRRRALPCHGPRRLAGADAAQPRAQPLAAAPSPQGPLHLHRAVWGLPVWHRRREHAAAGGLHACPVACRAGSGYQRHRWWAPTTCSVAARSHQLSAEAHPLPHPFFPKP